MQFTLISDATGEPVAYIEALSKETAQQQLQPGFSIVEGKVERADTFAAAFQQPRFSTDEMGKAAFALALEIDPIDWTEPDGTTKNYSRSDFLAKMRGVWETL